MYVEGDAGFLSTVSGLVVASGLGVQAGGALSAAAREIQQLGGVPGLHQQLVLYPESPNVFNSGRCLKS